MSSPTDLGRHVDVREARRLFPATAARTYFNTAAVGLASSALTATYHGVLDEWSEVGFDYARGEAAAEAARTTVAALIGAEASDVALIASVSAVAGFIAAQFGEATPGDNVVIGEREYSSNHFPWRLLAHKGYEVRQVPFRNGGLDPSDIAGHVDQGTRLIAFSGVQTASGHRSDVAAISEIARAVGALVFVDGSQMVGAVPVADVLECVDVLATSDHKFLMHAGRGMGYCYLAPDIQDRLTPINAGWKAGAVPFQSFFGPEMTLSTTASRFDNSISWLAAMGNEAALEVFTTFGADAVYRRNGELAEHLRASLAEIGWAPIELHAVNRSTIVSVPTGDADLAELIRELGQRDIVCSARDGHLRLAVHLYNHEDDIARITAALTEL